SVSPLGVTGVLCTGLVNASFYGMGPIFAQQIGLDTAGVSLFMGVPILAGLLMQWPMGWLSDRFDRRAVLTGVVFSVAVVSAAIVPLVGVSFPAVLVLATMYGGLSLTIYSLSISHANDFISPKDLVRASSAFVMIYGIGASFGPFAASTLMSAIGPEGLFIYSAAINLGIGLFALYRMRMRAAKPKDEQGRHVAMPNTTQAVKSLDPRTEWDEQAGLPADPTAASPAETRD
ncbi:MAG: MFS transporter, partial [Rhodospirillaceae bacterium]|nr:MFS transporter [Rhodospirillaceae bacterium]